MTEAANNHSKEDLSIAILSPCGWGNLGDAAVQDSIIQEIYRRYPNAKIQGITLNPADTEVRHKIPASTTIGFEIIPGYGVREKHLGYPAYRLPEDIAVNKKTIGPHEPDNSFKEKLRKLPFIFKPLNLIRRTLLPLERKLKKIISEIKHIGRSIKRLRSIDLLIASGGGQIDDEWGGAWGHPYALMRWSIIAKLTGTPFRLLSIGVCGLDLKTTAFFIRIMRRFADYCSFRDPGSKEMVSFSSAYKNDPVFPDLAFGLQISDNYKIEFERGRPFIGVSPISYCDPRIWPKKSAEIYNGILNKQAKTVEYQLNQGNDIVMIAADLADKRAINDLMYILKSQLSSEMYKRILYPDEHSVECLVAYWKEAKFVIASRLHGVLLAYVCHTPVIALSYDRKVTALANLMEQSNYLFDIVGFSADDLIKKTVQIEIEQAAVRSHIQKMHLNCLERLQKQYDNVLKV